MITSIEIQGLRGIRGGKIEGLAPVTVLIGPNGCGKTTVLEALGVACAGSSSAPTTTGSRSTFAASAPNSPPSRAFPSAIATSPSCSSTKKTAAKATPWPTPATDSSAPFSSPLISQRRRAASPPWTSPKRSPTRACSRRVLISGLLSWDRSQPRPLTAWAESATRTLLAELPRHGWKRAFRIWHAAVKPETPSFVEGALDETAHHCIAALKRTKAALAIASLLAPGSG